MSRPICSRHLGGLLATAIFAAASLQAQTTWYVDDDAPNDPAPGDPTISDPLEDGSAEHPFDAIQEGIDAAVDGDTVLVLDGTYTGDGNRDLDFRGKAITVRSTDPTNPTVVDRTVIDCESNVSDAHRAVAFSSGEVQDSVLAGFTITGGYGPTEDLGDAVVSVGGAIFVRESSPTIAYCCITGNATGDHAYFGGAIYCYGSDASIRECMIHENDCCAIRCAYGGEPIIQQCIITANDAGGIRTTRLSAPLIVSCLITRNFGATVGGGVACADSSARIVNCLIAGNSVTGHLGHGGGLYFRPSWTPQATALVGAGGGASPVVTGCTISANSAEGAGGGIYSAQDATVVQCVLSQNWAPTGLEVALCLEEATPTLRISFSDVDGGLETVFVEDGCTLHWGPGNIDADPLFVDPDGPDNDPSTWEDNDYHLFAGSPCIDAGCNWAVPVDSADLDVDADTDEITPLDLDNEGRFFDDPDTADTGCGNTPIVDVGAYEFGGTGPQPCFGDFDDDWDVDLSDLAALLANYGDSGTCGGDLDCDGDVDLADLTALLAAYGTMCE